MSPSPFSRRVKSPPPTGNPRSNPRSSLSESREAMRVNSEIERGIALDRDKKRSNAPQMRVLFLGQAESGKSTTLKAFKLQYSPRAFAAELQMWKKVIHLNLVRHINIILDTLLFYEQDVLTKPRSGRSESFIMMTPELKRLRFQLAPLTLVENELRKRISPQELNVYEANLGQRTIPRRISQPELAVRAPDGLQSVIHAVSNPYDSNGRSAGREGSIDLIRVLSGEVKQLWRDPIVHAILKKYRINLPESSGFFIDDLDRLVDPNYEPSGDDVLRARLKTHGASEHRIIVENGREQGKHWVFIDVGGSRQHRARWASFFDDVNSIIFLAPVSTFDQYLEEDPDVNRLEDTFVLWSQICSNKLLKHVNMIIFLNKIDILRQKLEEGIIFKNSVASYKEFGGKNNLQDILSYLRNQFTSIHASKSSTNRTLSAFVTSVINRRTTAEILEQVKANILEGLLRETGMM